MKRQIRFIDTAMDIRERSPKEAKSITFLGRPFVQATLPHRDPGNVAAWGRENGNFSMTIQPGFTMKYGKPKSIGIPYGTIPRLLLFWATEEVIKTKSPTLEIGQSLSAFMRKLGLDPEHGGPRSDAARLKEQVKRLFSARIAFAYEEEQDDAPFVFEPIQTANKIWLAWDTNQPMQDALFDSYIQLSKEFYEELASNPVPLDMRVLHELKQSPLALDLYSFLTYRVPFLKKDTLITYEQLAGQIGGEYSRVRDFKAKVLRYLKMIYQLYPDLKLEERSNGLMLKTSAPSVPFKIK